MTAAMRRVGLIAATMLSVLACGEPTDLAIPLASPSPQSSPAATPLLPSAVKLAVTHRMEATANELGDPVGELHITITSNIPVTVDLQPYLTINGQLEENALSCADGLCILKGPGDNAKIDLSWRGRAPAGRYVLKVTAYSYAGPLGQEGEYTAWVGGPQGPKLAGNPQAIRDPEHPAVLDLQVSAAWNY